MDVTPYGGHHLLLELGRGGTAQVFVAVQSGAQGVDKLVVLKFLKRTHLENPELQQMFINEARFSARLNHANIVQTSAIIETAMGPAIVMEYLEGQPLSTIRARAGARLSLEMHLRIIIDVLRGLHYAHELTDFDGNPLNVVHRDISPHNVFVTYDGLVKVIDFGIVKHIGAGVETATGVIKGKIGYMPAEQIDGRQVDRRADLYSVGVMLWEAVTGKRLWKGLSDVTIMHRVLTGDLPKPSEVAADVPEELEHIIMKALSLDRERRHATALELESDLESFLSKRPPVTGRDIGGFLLREFGDVRAETKRIIDQELKHLATGPRSSPRSAPSISAGPPSSGPPSRSGPLSRTSATQIAPSLAPAGYTTVSGSTAGLSGAQGTGATSRAGKAFRALFVGALVVMGSVVAWRASTHTQGTPPAPSGAAPTPAEALSAVTPPAPVVAPSTDEAAPALDEAASADEETDAQPSAGASPSASATSEPTAKRTTRTTKQPHRTTRPPQRTTRTAVSNAAAAPPEPKPTAEAAPPAAPAVKSPKTGCEVPYTIDADGIKRFKVECM